MHSENGTGTDVDYFAHWAIIQALQCSNNDGKVSEMEKLVDWSTFVDCIPALLLSPITYVKNSGSGQSSIKITLFHSINRVRRGLLGHFLFFSDFVATNCEITKHALCCIS